MLYMEHEDQRVLTRSGDDLRIEWGRFYMAVPQSDGTVTQVGPASIRKDFVRRTESVQSDSFTMPRAVSDGYPVMACTMNLGNVGAEPLSSLITLAYDDIYAIEYFGDKREAYWKRNGLSATGMIAAAYVEYDELIQRCDSFDQQLLADAVLHGGEKYADLLALSYRQAIAAHKLVTDAEGRLLFLSKECYSNGCIATVDVSYPSIPLFLLYQPELVRAMMRPIFKLAASEAWPFEFAPHDAGQYPLANGQVYASDMEGQMPVEECGNMLIMTAAVSLLHSQTSFAGEHWELLTSWADYLTLHGQDPENQLCTDDFAGHLARNTNLSIKAIMGVASYSLLCGLLGHDREAQRYLEKAREMAGIWEEMAGEGDHSKLAFGHDGTWSLKYNLIWDTIFGTQIFSSKIKEQEVAWYLTQQQRYGVPLDSRENYTKSDWLLWAASLAEHEDDFKTLIAPLWTYLNETPDRVPFSDWHHTETARQMNFQHRSVLGGMFIKLLKERWAEL
jgi:hypothetical protein